MFFYIFYNMVWVVVLVVFIIFVFEVWFKYFGFVFVMVVGSKNIILFCLMYVFILMIEYGGVKWMFGVLLGIFVVLFVLGFFVYFFNVKW